MFDDILEKKEKKERQSDESLIDALRYNIKAKSKLIDDLIKKINSLEKELEKYKK